MLKQVGIYSITNIHNTKRYIGSSRNIEERWRVHGYRLRWNKHHSIHLQKSYNIDPNQFKYEIVELIGDLSQLEIREQYWIDHYQSYKSENGYNACRTVSKLDPERAKERWAKPGEKEKQCVRMKKICSSIEHRKKLSIGHKKYFKNIDNCLKKAKESPHRKEVRYKETGQVFISIAQAAKTLGVSVVKIRDSATGKRKSNGGMSFEWVKNG